MRSICASTVHGLVIGALLNSAMVIAKENPKKIPSSSTNSTKPTRANQQPLSAREIFKKSVSEWGGDIFILPKSKNYLLDTPEFDPKSWFDSTVHGRHLPPHPIGMHGVAWDYDLRIPLVFYDPSGRWFKPGQYKDLAVQQDITPTLAAMLGVPAPARRGGHPLEGSLLSNRLKSNHSTNKVTEVPKVVLVLVQDQMGLQYLAAHPGVAPFYESMMAKGANYLNATVAQVDVETSVGHAAIGTGAWPKEHGVAGNIFFHRGFWHQIAALSIWLSPDETSRHASPNFFFTPTLADVWSVARENKPVILAVAPVPRAAIGVGGHGALFNGGTKTNVVWMDDVKNDGTWTTETDNYSLPISFKDRSLLSWVKGLVKENGTWRGHQLVNSSGALMAKVSMASPALVKQEVDLTIDAISELNIGRDNETDLIYLNTKSTDYCGHLFGYESEECGEVLAAADSEAKRLVDRINQQTGGSYVVVLTADHGAAPLPEVSGGYRYDRSRLKKEMNEIFDRQSNRTTSSQTGQVDSSIELVQLITSSQIYVNREKLTANGLAMNDLVRWLKAYKVKMQFPYNALADDWTKTNPKEALFFEDVISADDLK